MELHKDGYFFRFWWIWYYDLKKKTIELRFGQTISAFMFDGILSCQYHKRRRHRVSFTVNGSLSFFHKHKQSRLSFCWRAVDFVNQNNISKHWAFLKFKTSLLRIEYWRSQHIRWHQIGGKLNS